MTIRHCRFARVEHRAGFSMIDVLVAIVVLATALLALAALQGAITRNAADSRARSQVASFVEGLFEQARAGNASAGTANYDAIVSQTITPNASGTALEKSAFGIQSVAGISNLQIVETVSTYAADATGAFSVTTAVVPSGTGTYKQMNITTTWTDASGTPRQLAMDSIISPLQTSTDKTLDNAKLSVSQTPIVREFNPGAASGVIPIAISDTSQSAASNPKPDIISTKGKGSLVVGSSYNVLTFQTPDQTTGAALIQQRVEAQVVGCSCQYGQGSTDTTDIFQQAFRPTYWNGTKYTDPKGLTATTGSGSSKVTLPATNVNHPGQDPASSATQSSYCTQCCRDHHDRTDHVDSPSDTSNTAADPNYVYFDSFPTPATADVNTYAADAVTLANGATDKYVEACRLIRTGGVFHTATDLNSEHFGLLATQTYPKATTVVPDNTSTSCSGQSFSICYQNFAKDYLTQKYVDSGTPSANAVYASNGLDNPTQIVTSSTQTYYYLDARGLYVDYLEAETAQAISDAYGTCPSTSSKANCVLPLLPFTAINTTELADWTSCTAATGPCTDATTTGMIVYPAVTNTYNTTTGDFIVAGYASLASTPTLTQSYAVATMSKSNSGVAIADPVDPNDTATLTDAQLFSITPASTGGGVFSVTLGNTANTADPTDLFTKPNWPTATWSNPATSKSVLCTVGSTSNPNPYSCQPDVLASGGTALDLIIAKYNPTTTSNANQSNVTCATVDGGTNTVSATASMNNSQFCPNYAVNTIAVGVTPLVLTPVVTSDGLVAETSKISFPGLKPSDAITITFTRTSNNLAPLACTTKISGKSTTYTGAWSACK
jgi:Tfp pilus assembly protein PilV